MPKISVLMPIYNTNSAHLREAIESILNQTFSDLEFLILNDSPENSELDDIVKSYNDERIIYIKNEKNLGITPSRNKLIDLAKGEYLAVMDHDDISLPERFEKQVVFLDNNLDYGVVSSNAKYFHKKKISKYAEKDEKIKCALFQYCSILHPASMIRKSVLVDNNIKYEEQFTPAEDYALWCRLIPYTKFHNLQDVLFKYRAHENNTTKKQNSKMVIADEKIKIFVKAENPELYKSFKDSLVKIITVNLFGFIPVLKIDIKGSKGKIKLFGIIPIMSFKVVIKF